MTDVTELQPPSDATATQSNDHESVTITWTDNSSIEDNFVLERRERNISIGSTWSSWTQIATPATNDTSYEDTDVVEKIYQYRVASEKT